MHTVNHCAPAAREHCGDQGPTPHLGRRTHGRTGDVEGFHDPSVAVAFEHRLAHRAQGKAWVSLQAGGPFGVRRGVDWGGSCESSGVSLRLGGAVVTFSLPDAAAVVSRKTSASRRRSKAA